jgi:phage shock protein C
MSTFTDTTSTDTSTESPQPGLAGRPQLRRAVDGRMLAGVCAGLADYLAVDVTVVRVAFGVLTFLGGAGIPAYLACLLLIPAEGADESLAGSLLSTVEHSL